VVEKIRGQKMKKPVLQNDAFLADVKDAPADRRHFNLWWLGQSGFLIQSQKRHALIDPYLSDSLTKKYEKTDKPHVRMTERVVAPGRLDFIDVVTSSHNHTDHFDPDTLNPLRAKNPRLQIIVPEANLAVSAERLSVDPDIFIGLDSRHTKPVGGFRFLGVPAAHNDLATNECDENLYLGSIIEMGMHRIYHAGDTLLWDGMVDYVRPFNVDVAIFPINGNQPERRVAGNLNGKEAAQLAKDIGAKIVIPCHYDMFEFNTVEPDEFIAACEEIDQPFKVLQNGERWSSSELERQD
jgi:L-ascorbate metabolism protein UlaG (beta-lactamase superfamily)